MAGLTCHDHDERTGPCTPSIRPVAAAVVAWVWLGESLVAVQILGGVIVLIGILAETAR